jgi:curved DNA-binding protein CbpA
MTMIQKGDLAKIGFPRLVQWLITGDKVGTVKVANDNERKFLQVFKGRLLSAYSDSPKDRLWIFFYRNGRLNEKQFRELRAREREGVGFETLAVAQGLLTKEDVQRTREEQAHDIMLSIFDWTKGEFYYYPDRFLQKEMQQLNLSLQDLLQEGLRHTARLKELDKLLPAHEKVQVKQQEEFQRLWGNTIVPGRRMVLKMIREERRVHEIVAGSLLSRLDTMEYLAELLERGVIHLPGRRLAERDLKIAEAVSYSNSGKYWQAFKVLQKELAKDPGDEVLRERLRQASADLAADIKRRIGSLNRIPVIEGSIDPSLWHALELDAADGFIISRLDGATSLRKLFSLVKMDSKRILTTIYNLLVAGIVVLKDPEEDPEIVEQQRQKVRRLIARWKGANYYERLGVGVDARLREIKQAYHAHAREYHPDVLADIRDPELRALHEEAFGLIQEAYAVLGRPKSRQKYDVEMGFKSDTPEAREQLRLIEKARLQFNLGVRHFRARDYHRAVEYIQSAIDLYPEDPLFYAKLAEVCTKNPRWYRTGKNAVRKAIELDPENASYYVLLGIILKNEGEILEAERQFRNAIALDPNQRIARRELVAMGKRVPAAPRPSRGPSGGEITLRRERPGR